MTNNMKKFLDAASKDADLMKKLDAIQEPAEFIAAAKGMGYALTETDFNNRGCLDKRELDDDDLDAIAGGGFDRICLFSLHDNGSFVENAEGDTKIGG